MPIEYVRQKSDAEQRTDAREKVAAAARRGEGPSSFATDDVAWAFRDREEEIPALEQQAADARAARDERERQLHAGTALRRETEKVLAEWAKRDLAELQRKAQAEAARRLNEA